MTFVYVNEQLEISDTGTTIRGDGRSRSIDALETYELISLISDMAGRMEELDVDNVSYQKKIRALTVKAGAAQGASRLHRLWWKQAEHQHAKARWEYYAARMFQTGQEQEVARMESRTWQDISVERYIESLNPDGELDTVRPRADATTGPDLPDMTGSGNTPEGHICFATSGNLPEGLSEGQDYNIVASFGR